VSAQKFFKEGFLFWNAMKNILQGKSRVTAKFSTEEWEETPMFNPQMKIWILKLRSKSSNIKFGFSNKIRSKFGARAGSIISE